MNTIKPVETEPKSNAKSLDDWQSIRLVVEFSLPLPTVGHYDRILLSSVSDHCSYRRHGMPYLNSCERFLVSSVSVFFKHTYILKYVCFERSEQMKFYTYTIYHMRKMFVRPGSAK